MSTALPSWTEGNLARHHAKRTRENPGCFEDLLGITGRTVTVEEYRDRSVLSVTGAWCEYEAESRDFERNTYLPARASLVDDDLVVAVTDMARTRFVTCFHEHFQSRRPTHGDHPGHGVSVAQRRMRYREALRIKVQGRLVSKSTTSRWSAMADHRRELKSLYDALRRLYADLHGTTLARRNWHAEVPARRTLGSDERIEHWFLAEHFLTTWSHWGGLFERFCRYFGQPADSFPRTWSQFIANCDGLVFRLTRDEALDEIIARSWTDPDDSAFRPLARRKYDIATIYSQVARAHERAQLVVRSQKVEIRTISKEATIQKAARGRGVLATTRRVIAEQNDRLVERWHDLPRGVQDRVWFHLRHYLHAVLGVSWLVDVAEPGTSALLSLSWRMQAVPRPMRKLSLDLDESPPASALLERLQERLQTAIRELGYEAVVEDLISDDMIGGDDSPLASDQVMVIPGHMDDSSRPILLAATRGWNGKDPLSFTRVIRQVKARLIAGAGTIRHVVVLCDAWDTPAFEDEHREELEAHARRGVGFSFVLVGFSSRMFATIPIEPGRDQR